MNMRKAIKFYNKIYSAINMVFFASFWIAFAFRAKIGQEWSMLILLVWLGALTLYLLSEFAKHMFKRDWFKKVESMIQERFEKISAEQFEDAAFMSDYFGKINQDARQLSVESGAADNIYSALVMQHHCGSCFYIEVELNYKFRRYNVLFEDGKTVIKKI